MKFKVNRYWQLWDTVEVRAESIDEAIDRAHNTDLNELQGKYVQGSLYSDPLTDVLPLLEEGGV